MTPTERFNKLKKQADKDQQAADRAAGAYDQLLSRLKLEYGCDSPDKGAKLLKKLNGEIEALEHQFEEDLTEFENEYSKRLQANSGPSAGST